MVFPQAVKFDNYYFTTVVCVISATIVELMNLLLVHSQMGDKTVVLFHYYRGICCISNMQMVVVHPILDH